MTRVKSTAVPANRLGAFVTAAEAPAGQAAAEPLPAAPVKPNLRSLAMESSGLNAGIDAHPAPRAALTPLQRGAAGHETQQALKNALAKAKLMAALACAALRSDQPVTPYVERAAAWLQQAGVELAGLWLARANTTAAADGLSGYHRYEIHRLLVDLIARRPELPFAREPAEVAAWFAGVQSCPPAPAEPPWQSAGADLDVALGEGRALARVLESASRCDFNRSLDAVLDDARRVLNDHAAEWTARVAAARRGGQRGGPPLGDAERRIVHLHALNIGGRVYAAAFERVHRESVALIQDYQTALNAGRHEEAEAHAQAYQDQGLGYAGIEGVFKRNMDEIARLAHDTSGAGCAPRAPGGDDNQPGPIDSVTPSA